MVRRLYLADHHSGGVIKGSKKIAKLLDLIDTNFRVKFRDTHKIENSNSIGISVFGYKIKKYIQFIHQENGVTKNIEEKGKIRYYMLLPKIQYIMKMISCIIILYTVE